MLRSFRVANHRSIRDEQELLLISAYRKDAPVLSVAAIFGANASGKSNVVDSLRWMDRAVQSSYRSWEPESGVARHPFRLDPGCATEPTAFVIDLVIDGVQFVYGFSTTGEAIQEEWLHTYPRGRERVVFERRNTDVEFGSTVPERRSRAEVLGALLRPNALLLSTAVQAGQAEVMPVYRWFRDSLRILDSRRSWARTPGMLTDRVIDGFRRYPEFTQLLKAADLGITDVLVVPDNDDELWFLHGADRVELGLADQSDGTLAWVDLLLAALSSLEKGALLVIDEIDASLHPRLTARLVELYRDNTTNPRGAQLLFTTHDATLLGTTLGEDVLQRDEIWFVEKQDGASRLYPLTDFHPRKGENRERRYLAGSYGAVPVVFPGSLVDEVLAVRRARDGAA